MAASVRVNEGYRRGEEPPAYVRQDRMAMTLSPRTPSPQFERSVLSATPTPLKRQGPEQPNGPPRYVFYALREEDDREIGFSASAPKEEVEPSDALAADLAAPTQFIYTTASAEAALFFAESSRGPGFAGATHGLPRTRSKRVVARIDLGNFKGEVLDISSMAGCRQHDLKKDSKAWEHALDLQIVLLVGYVPPRLIVNVFDLETDPLPSWRCPTNALISFDSFTATLPGLVKQKLARDWAGENAQQCLQSAPGRKQRDEQGLASDTRSKAAVCWEAKQTLDEQMRKLEARRQRIKPHIETVIEHELTACENAFKVGLSNGAIGPCEEAHVIVMKGWRCIEEFPYSCITNVHDDSEVCLRGTQYQARLALNGPAAIECVHTNAADSPVDGRPCRHCVWTKPAEFQLLRNVGRDGPNMIWPPYFRLFCFDPATEELAEILNTLGGTHIRDSEHPHVFPSDEVGFSFALERLPGALAGLEATLPRTSVEDIDEVSLPQRPLYLMMVVPENVPNMQGQAHAEAPLYVAPCICEPCQ